MEKIITIQYNLKTYNPTNIQRIITKGVQTFVLLSNKGLELTTQNGKTLVYGK
jgi:hypothetical protein